MEGIKPAREIMMLPMSKQGDFESLKERLEPLKEKTKEWTRWFEGDQKDTEPTKPSLEEYMELKDLARQMLTMIKEHGKVPERSVEEVEFDKEIQEMLQETVKELHDRVNARVKGILYPVGPSPDYTFSPEKINVPAGMSKEHLSAIFKALMIEEEYVFQPRILPDVSDISAMRENYTECFFPLQKTDYDRRAMVNAFVGGKGKKKLPQERNEAMYIRAISAMGSELRSIGGRLVLMDTALKSDLKDGKFDEYVDRTRRTGDPFAPLLKELGFKESRMNWNTSDFDVLFRKVTERIKAEFKKRGLPDIPFKVQFPPALLLNLEMTLYNSENSRSRSWEYTSTQVEWEKDKDGNLFKGRVAMGSAKDGGAAAFEFPPSNKPIRKSDTGFRFTIIFGVE